MDPEQEKMLEETHRLARKNHDILKKLHRSMVTSHILRAIYWIIIIGIAIGAFYFLQPYLEQVQGIYNNATELFNKDESAIVDAPSTSDEGLGGLFDIFQPPEES